MARSTKLILIFEQIKGKLIQSPLNPKVYKTWENATYGAFAFGEQPTIKTEVETDCVRVLTFKYGKKSGIPTQTVFLVDVGKFAVQTIEEAAPVHTVMGS